jgi:FKBP-type peptidyl-prolyl cis-trans isomerase 2
MTIKKNDFIEIEFTGKIKDTEQIFDTTIKEDAEKANLKIKDIRPFTMSVGNKMLPGGFDQDLEGKEIGQKYTLELTPKQAFGKRDQKLVKMVPTKLFHEQKINPVRGLQLNLDGQVVKVLSNSGGRTLVDFNNPLAGKDIIYEYKILKVVTDDNEKINAMQDFLFRKRFDFKVEDNKIIFKVEKTFEPFIKMMSEKIKELLGKDAEAEIIEPKEEKKKE